MAAAAAGNDDHSPLLDDAFGGGYYTAMMRGMLPTATQTASASTSVYSASSVRWPFARSRCGHHQPLSNSCWSASASSNASVHYLVPTHRARSFVISCGTFVSASSRISDDVMRIILSFASHMLLDLISCSLVDRQLNRVSIYYLEDMMAHVGSCLVAQHVVLETLTPHVATDFVRWHEKELLYSELFRYQGDSCEFDVNAAYRHFADDDVILHCNECRTPLMKTSDVISRSYRIGAGKAFLTGGAYNVTISVDSHEASYTSGNYTVCQVSCGRCSSKLGVTYVDAHDRANMYKVGKFLVAQKLLVRPECCQMPSKVLPHEKLCYRCAVRAERGTLTVLRMTTCGFRNVSRTRRLCEILRLRCTLEGGTCQSRSDAYARRCLRLAWRAFQKCSPLCWFIVAPIKFLVLPFRASGRAWSLVRSIKQAISRCPLPLRSRQSAWTSSWTALSPTSDLTTEESQPHAMFAEIERMPCDGVHEAGRVQGNAVALGGPEAWAASLEAQFALLASSPSFANKVWGQLQSASLTAVPWIRQSMIGDSCCNLACLTVIQFIEVANLAAQTHMFGMKSAFCHEADLRAKLLIRLLPVLLPSCAADGDLLLESHFLASVVRQRWLLGSAAGPPLAVVERDTILAALAREVKARSNKRHCLQHPLVGDDDDAGHAPSEPHRVDEVWQSLLRDINGIQSTHVLDFPSASSTLEPELLAPG